MKPTADQIEFLKKCCEAQRLTYNWAVTRYNSEYTSKSRAIADALDAWDTDKQGSLQKLLRLSRAGVTQKPKREKKGCRTKAERDADQRWEDAQVANASGREAAFEKLAQEWKQYKIDHQAWVDAGQLNGSKPKHTKFEVWMEGWSALKSRWRRAYRHEKSGMDDIWSVPASVIDSGFNNAQAAYTRYYAWLKLSPAEKYTRPEVGRPRVHKSRSNGSFTYISTSGVEVTDRSIHVSNLGPVMLKERRYLPIGKTKKRITVSSRGGRWFVAFPGDKQIARLPADRPEVGIDVGIRHYAILSTGQRVDNPRFLEKQLCRLAMLQRRLSRKKGPVGRAPSKRWQQMKDKINRLQWRISAARSTFQHQLTHKLVSEYGHIDVETLGVQDMMLRREKRGKKKTSSKKLRREMGDAAWYEFRRQLQYKGEWRGTDVVAVDRWFPSTQQCMKCGETTEVNWRTRLCRCLSCGLVIDMDDNAAKNLLQEGSGLSSASAV
jgi:putative transposase